MQATVEALRQSAPPLLKRDEVAAALGIPPKAVYSIPASELPYLAPPGAGGTRGRRRRWHATGVASYIERHSMGLLAAAPHPYPVVEDLVTWIVDHSLVDADGYIPAPVLCGVLRIRREDLHYAIEHERVHLMRVRAWLHAWSEGENTSWVS